MNWLAPFAYGLATVIAMIGMAMMLNAIKSWQSRRRDIKRRLAEVKVPPPRPTAKVVRIDRRRRPT